MPFDGKHQHRNVALLWRTSERMWSYVAWKWTVAVASTHLSIAHTTKFHQAMFWLSCEHFRFDWISHMFSCTFFAIVRSLLFQVKLFPMKMRTSNMMFFLHWFIVLFIFGWLSIFLSFSLEVSHSRTTHIFFRSLWCEPQLHKYMTPSWINHAHSVQKPILKLLVYGLNIFFAFEPSSNTSIENERKRARPIFALIKTHFTYTQISTRLFLA